MKQLIQSYKTGELGLFEVPSPVCHENGVVIETTASLVSAGTEKMIVDIAKKSLIGKARARPDLVKQVIDKMKKEGIKNTLEKVFGKLDTPIPLGYSCAGRISELGKNVSGLSVGDRVACGGAGYASHSEFNYIPKNLFVKIPENVDDIDASFVTVGSIALQGVRQAEPRIGERVAVIGLGLIGQITVQLLKASGCLVVGCDIDNDKLELAKKIGANVVCHSNDMIEKSVVFSEGHGVDSVIITASNPSSDLVSVAGEISRIKGKVVVVGLVGMDIPRDSYYKKELDLRLSMAYGPGRYDPEYEEAGIDYPFPFVRWTEQRNFKAFLDMVAEGKVTPKSLVTHQYDFSDVMQAYDLLSNKSKEKYLGIVLKYQNHKIVNKNNYIEIDSNFKNDNEINIGLVGAGNFTKAVILPVIKKIDGLNLVGLAASTGISSYSTGKKYGFKKITTNANELIKDSDVNSVIITTRHSDHKRYVVDAINNGKHVFVEKPLCISKDQLEEIVQVYEKSSKKPILQVGFNRRFSPMVRRMKNEIGQSQISVLYRINAGIIPLNSWIQDLSVGGGRVVGEVCHFIDTCSYLTGSEVKRVSAISIKKDDKSIPDEDNVNIILTYKNGSTASINYFAFGNQQMSKEYIEVFARNISIKMDDFRELQIFNGSKKIKVRDNNQDKGFKAEFEAFNAGIKSGLNPISFSSICNTTLTTFGIIESIKSGCPIGV